ncbi:hypothetical protein MCOR25_008250 [Pyricularia grisea]|uniref:Integral membrane protein n=1 Tax=Pyricularia grisea TaxID=148305 RepID=A0A6P8BLJ7_PYRGI|nr:uncharacterized protein PgNI_00495 [Pyricularia grisea]KAI6355316.1 hypothetical protein MCOR25_008250 [Pyricularia grisea]TLD17482.1 hypothetical protein PgNI_00495 [Pyricularia grisea]
MRRRLSAALLGVVVLGSLPTAILAHGGESMNMDQGQAMPKPAEDSGLETYFSYPEYQGALYAHIALMTVSWVFMLPVAVMFSISRSRYTFPAQVVFVVTNLTGLILGMIFNENTPDLYPNNAHHKLGWAVTALSCAQVVLGVLVRRSEIFSPSPRPRSALYTPVSTAAMAEHQRASAAPGSAQPHRFSFDSGQGTEPNTASLCSRPRYSSSSSQHDEEVALKDETMLLDGTDFYARDHDDDGDFGPGRKQLARHGGTVHRVLALAGKTAGIFSTQVLNIFGLGYNVIDRIILILGFVAICTGVIAQGRFFEGQEIFSGLAHWIKGGVFFWLGILTLGRWTGAFAEIGWAWNLRPRPDDPTAAAAPWRPSAEFVESALIFFYGSTNIFLEHLGGGADSAWSAQDLEHVAITVLFIGGGLCGMLVESATVRELLNTAVAGHDDENNDHLSPPPPSKLHGSVSLNPIPALVILLLGIMMSSHTQHDMVSGMVHKQWGDLLKGAAVARGFSYVLMYLKPPRSVLPSRPPTELLAAFGLMAGGVIFMASSHDTVQGMINQGLDAMFMYTVTMGLVAFLMAWVVIVMALKGWAVRKEARWQMVDRSHVA